MTQYDQHIAAWRDAFQDETTGINHTIRDLLWNYAAFRTMIHIVHLAEERGARPPLNQMIFNLVSEGFWSGLLLGARRLLDKAPINGPKGVYSIRSVVNDVKASRTWLNRKIYVERVRSAGYDLDRLLQEQHDKLVAAKGRPVWADPELRKSEAAHRHFDVLSGVSPSQRSPNDLISLAALDKVEARLADLDRIAEHVNSHLAHAGSKQSRENRGLGDFDIHDAQEALKRLKQVADLVGTWFADESRAGLAAYLGDQFEGLDHAMVDSSDLVDLEEQWQLTDREIAGWSIRPENV